MDQIKSQQIPAGVRVLAVLEYLAGVFYLLLGILSFFRTDLVARVMIYHAYDGLRHPLIGIILLLLGIIHFILGDGLWEGRHWAYLWVIIASILYIVAWGIAFTVLDYVSYVSVIGFAVNVVVLLYLLGSSRAQAYLA